MDSAQQRRVGAAAIIGALVGGLGLVAIFLATIIGHTNDSNNSQWPLGIFVLFPFGAFYGALIGAAAALFRAGKRLKAGGLCLVCSLSVDSLLLAPLAPAINQWLVGGTVHTWILPAPAPAIVVNGLVTVVGIWLCATGRRPPYNS